MSDKLFSDKYVSEGKGSERSKKLIFADVSDAFSPEYVPQARVKKRDMATFAQVKPLSPSDVGNVSDQITQDIKIENYEVSKPRRVIVKVKIAYD